MRPVRSRPVRVATLLSIVTSSSKSTLLFSSIPMVEILPIAPAHFKVLVASSPPVLSGLSLRVLQRIALLKTIELFPAAVSSPTPSGRMRRGWRWHWRSHVRGTHSPGWRGRGTRTIEVVLLVHLSLRRCPVVMRRHQVESLLLKVRLLLLAARGPLHELLGVSKAPLPRRLNRRQHHVVWRHGRHGWSQKVRRWCSSPHDTSWSPSHWRWHVVMLLWLGPRGEHVIVAPVIDAWMDEATRRTPGALPLVEEAADRPGCRGLAAGPGATGAPRAFGEFPFLQVVFRRRQLSTTDVRHLAVIISFSFLKLLSLCLGLLVWRLVND